MHLILRRFEGSRALFGCLPRRLTLGLELLEARTLLRRRLRRRCRRLRGHLGVAVAVVVVVVVVVVVAAAAAAAAVVVVAAWCSTEWDGHLNHEDTAG